MCHVASCEIFGCPNISHIKKKVKKTQKKKNREKKKR